MRRGDGRTPREAIGAAARRALAVLLVAVAALAAITPLAVGPAAAQTAAPSETPEAPATTEASDTSASDLARRIGDALEGGGRIIVIEPPTTAEGATAGAAEPAPTTTDYGLDAYDAVAATQNEMVAMTRTGLEAFAERLRRRIEGWERVLPDIERALTRESVTGEPMYWAQVIGMTAAFLAVAMLAVLLILGVGILRPWFVRQKRARPEGLVEKLPILLLRGALGFLGVGVSVLVAVGLGFLFGLDATTDAVRETVIICFAVYIASRLITLVWRVVLAPYLSPYRIPKLSDRDARRLFHWLWATATIALVFQGFIVWMETLHLPENSLALVRSGLTLVTVVLNILLVIANHRAVSLAIRDGRSRAEATLPALWASALWGWAVALYAIGAWAVTSWRQIEGLPPGPPLIVHAYVAVVTAFAVYGLTSFFLGRLFRATRRSAFALIEAAPAPAAPGFAPMTPSRVPETGAGSDADIDSGDEEAGPAARAYREALSPAARAAMASDEEGPGKRVAIPGEAPPLRRPGGMRSFEDLGGRVASVLALGAGAGALLRVWGADGMSAMGALSDRAIDIGAILFIGYVAYHALRIYIDQRIEEEGGYDQPAGPGEGEGGGVGASRLATLLPLFRNFLLTTILVTVALIVALELGVNVTPLFAGAGIIGLALGFGAQALVRDVISGAFFLIDDAFRKGEYIELGSVKGTVERISVRSFQLRHHLGYLHTVPFGEIAHMTNYSRDWVIMKLPIRLTYDTDVEKVRKLVKKLGEELLNDPEHGPKFLQPLKSQGVIQMEDSAMIVRVKFMTRPGDQWLIRKEVFTRLRALFEREGVRFAHREVTVRLAEDEAGPPEPRKLEAIGAAALRATEVEPGRAAAPKDSL